MSTASPRRAKKRYDLSLTLDELEALGRVFEYARQALSASIKPHGEPIRFDELQDLSAVPHQLADESPAMRQLVLSYAGTLQTARWDTERAASRS
jgi:hypothetical protein